MAAARIRNAFASHLPVPKKVAVCRKVCSRLGPRLSLDKSFAGEMYDVLGQITELDESRK